ncbi:5'/3'-nucleotidase SurE [Actinophytocola sp.]|uniref:5'/3'-nucleotidase SurE n=1 Tax=Actinophytocola sp. TaxID=1872138 RepID=UPI002ED8AE02
MTDQVAVFAPSPQVTVTVEELEGRPDVHLHAGGQGFWQSRMITALGSPVTLCCAFGGETGQVLRHLMQVPGIEVRARAGTARNGAYVHDRRGGGPRAQRHPARPRDRQRHRGPRAGRPRRDQSHRREDRMTPRVLVTNDDGIDSPGLHALARCALDLGWTPVVAAPVTESSGTSAGLTAARDDRQVAVERRTLPGLAGVTAYAVAAYPGLIALIACHDGFGDRPDLLLSGVNLGGNIGRAVLHSGTVGAALTAGVNGVRAVAVSLDTELDPGAERHWDTATAFCRDLLPGVMELPGSTVLNLNVPDRPVGHVRPLRWVPLATYGRVQSKVTQLGAGLIEVGSVVVEGELEPGSDAALLAEGHATCTPLRPVSEDEALLRSLRE